MSEEQKNKIIENVENTEDTLFDNILNIADNANMDFGINELAAILSLPDNEFSLLSEMILVEMNKSMNNPADKILLQQSLKESGYTLADLIKMQDEIMTEIDSHLVGELPEDRIDFLKRVMVLIINMLIEAENSAKKIVNIPIEIMEHGVMPTYAHEGDAAMDIYSPENYTINPGDTVLIKTGIKVAIPVGYALLVQPRSGQSLKTKLRVANTPGLIDAGYRDEVGVILENIESPIQDCGEAPLYGKSYTIEKGQRIAQLRLVEVPTINWLQVNDIKEIEGDRNGGFGSSGK